MTDISSSDWSETDGSNNQAAPAGFPENMAASAVNNAARAIMGAVKRMWNRINPVLSSAAGTTAYTLTRTVTSTSIVTGERLAFKVNATNTGASTLAVDGGTAKNIYKPTSAGPAALVAGDLVVGNYAEVAYDGTQYLLMSVAPQGASYIDPLTTRGDILRRGTSATERLALGAAKTYPRSDGTDIAFSAIQSVDLPSGAVVQIVAATPYTANTDLTTTIPLDDTIPQNNEGTQILTLSITPKVSTNKILLTFTGMGTLDSGSTFMSAALFKNSTANALQATVRTAGTGFAGILDMSYLDSPGSVSAQTYNLRVGPNSTGALRMNGSNSARYFGGVSAATLVAIEYASA